MLLEEELSAYGDGSALAGSLGSPNRTDGQPLSRFWIFPVFSRAGAKVNGASVFHGDSGDCRVEPPASRAVHHTREDPFKISLTTLFEQLGMAVPHSKSVRKKILTQHHTSVMHQLNNAPVLKGVLKVGLRLNKEKTDWLLLAWVEIEEKLPDIFTSESLRVHQQMNFFRQQGRDIPDDVSPEEIHDHASLRCADDEMRSADGCSDVDNRVRGRIAHRVARQNHKTFRSLACVGKNRACLFIIGPLTSAISRCHNWLLTNK